MGGKPPANSFVTDVRVRNDPRGIATAAGLCLRYGKLRADAGYFDTVKVKSAQFERPSVSVTFTRIVCVPGGTSASFTSMPVAAMKGFMRWVKSTAGFLRQVKSTESVSILAPHGPQIVF
jgi:hypothetical protein